MLTIDHVVEKYRSLGSDATFAADLRRYGLSDAAIKTAIAQRREFVGTNAAREQLAERFRTDLIARPRAKQITQYLSLFGSHERVIPLVEATANEPADVFWPVYLEIWDVCDGLWPLRKIILSTFRHRAAALSPIQFMEPTDRRFYDNLPDLVTVFRGCGRRRVRGMPWTTDRAIAEKFAHGGRFPQPPDPVIACAKIAKANLFFVSTARKESELILDPYCVGCLRLESVPSIVRNREPSAQAD
jgi:hypothetical protein